MTDILMHDPTNRKLWDYGFRSTLAFWWLWGLLILYMGWELYETAAIDLPEAYREKAAHDAFVANAVTTDARITGCLNLLSGSRRIIQFEFIPGGGSLMQGSGAYQGDCDDYPIGGTVIVRYLPTNPSQHEGVDEFDYLSSALRSSLIQIPFILFTLGMAVWSCVLGALLSINGRVRIGRIISVRHPPLGQSLVRYTVADDDGKQRTGWRFMYPDNIVPPLEAGAPIPVLYANKWVHQAFGLFIPSERPQPTEEPR